MSLLSTIWRTGIATEPLAGDADALEIARAIERTTRRLLGRSLAIREVDAGSCNGCELEITALSNPFYDCERFGIRFVASPRHADMLLVTGPVTRNMEVPLRKTWEATPAPRLVVAVGDCARDCGVFRGGYGVRGGVGDVVPVHAFIGGCPPEPRDILLGLLGVLDRVPRHRGASR